MKTGPHLNLDMSLPACSFSPRMYSVAARASALLSLWGLPKLVGFAARRNGKARCLSPCLTYGNGHELLPRAVEHEYAELHCGLRVLPG